MSLARWLFLFAIFLRSSVAADIGLVRIGDSWRFFRGTSEPSQATGWTTPEFDDQAWSAGQAGFSSWTGFGEMTPLFDYGTGYGTVYFRKHFVVADTNNIGELVLRIDYDDGFVAYINGKEVVRRGVPGVPDEPVSLNTLAVYHPRGPTEEIAITNAANVLRAGTNILAIQIVPSTSPDYTFALVPELLANIVRGPFVQNTTVSSTQIAWKTLSQAAAAIEFGTNENSIQRIEVDLGATNHLATLGNLQPDTRYFYRAVNRFGERETFSDWRPFRTFKRTGPVTFHVVGDSGWATAPQFLIQEQMDRSPADLLMHVGDVVYYAFDHFNADLRCFSIYHEQMRTVPWFIALGNHDSYLDREAALQSFFLPTNSVTGSELFYSFDHGDVHFVAAWADLEAAADYKPGSPEYNWLDQDLAASTKPWKFLFFHHTWRSSAYHGNYDDYDRNFVLDSVQIDSSFAELARRHGAQIIFNGHDHIYERLMPSGGPVSFVTGGGGANLYGFARFQPDSAQFSSRYHFLRVTVDGDETTVQGVDYTGAVFDELHLHRNFPARQIFSASWNSPVIEAKAAGDTNANVLSQNFDFIGTPIAAPMGLFTSCGRLFVNNDSENLYLGLDEAMVRAGEEILLFLEVPGLAGVSSMRDVGNGIVDPEGEGADGLDFLSNLSFESFSPSIGVVLGDEFGDAPGRDFRRAGQLIPTGQGAFYLSNGLPMVPLQRLAQFNRSPQDFTAPYEQNADFIEVAIPYSSLGGLQPGDTIKIGVITALQGINTNIQVQSRQLDSSGIGYSVQTNSNGTVLEGVVVRLAAGSDPDHDGLTSEDEIQRGTDPNNSDSDGDTMPDGWEVKYGFNPLVASPAEADGDLDEDGMANASEYRAGTNPKDEGSRLNFSTAEIENGLLQLTWRAVVGKRYNLQFRDSLSEDFRDVGNTNLPKTAQNPIESFWLNFSPELPPRARYYRVELVE